MAIAARQLTVLGQLEQFDPYPMNGGLLYPDRSAGILVPFAGEGAISGAPVSERESLAG